MSAAYPKFRDAQPSDAGGLKQCIEAAYAEYRGVIHDLPPVSEGLDQDIAENLVLVAEDASGAILGGIVVLREATFWLVANLAVSPLARGLGLGAEFMEQIEARAAHAGIAELRLATHIKMPRNVAFYEHLGWTISGQDGSKVFMRKFCR